MDSILLPFYFLKNSNMDIQEAKFVGSFPNLKTCPGGTLPEYAFIGRSNVGKSSLINMLTNRKGLAMVSKKPGKTMAINFFLINEEWHLVDLPGYGYAVRSKKMLKAFDKMIHDYMEFRKNLFCAFVLIDVNVPANKNDLGFINWLGKHEVPFVIVYTKTDRLPEKKMEDNVKEIQGEILKTWNELPQQFYTSAINKNGREEILEFIENINAQAQAIEGD